MTTSPFLVHVARLRRETGTRWREVRTGTLDPAVTAERASEAESRVPAGAAAEIECTLESFLGGVQVTGTVRAPWEGQCRRCTAPVGGELVVPVAERFLDEPDDEAYGTADGGDTLDLEPLVTDALLLELPLAPLCRQDCAGLCTWCGNDRNTDPCDCVAPVDPRWSTLDVLRTTPVDAD